jgi:uncharacterized membrane protein YfhO
VIDKSQEKYVSRKLFDSSQSSIKLKSYAPNKLVYEAKCSSEQMAVFSEVYYPEGWISKIDGNESSYFRADYIFRSMLIPAGSHEIVFEFKPQSYRIGNSVSRASSILLVFIIGGVIIIGNRNRKRNWTNSDRGLKET